MLLAILVLSSVIKLNFRIGNYLAGGEINVISLSVLQAESKTSSLSLRVAMVDPCISLKRTLPIRKKPAKLQLTRNFQNMFYLPLA